jgi:hypothetical protein
MQNPNYLRGKTNGLAVTSLIIGILSWVFFLISICLNYVIVPLFAVATLGVGLVFYICTLGLFCFSPIGWLVGTVLGSSAKSQIRQTGEEGAGLANAGFIINVIGLGLTLLLICSLLAYAVFAGTAGISDFFNIPSY